MPADHLNNMINPSMNNLMSIDYTIKNLTSSDHDYILSRWSQEYPRMATNFKRKDSPNKPWGLKSDP